MVESQGWETLRRYARIAAPVVSDLQPAARVSAGEGLNADMQERLFAALCHHLRIPLNAIAGSLPQLRSGSLGARERALDVLERNLATEADLISSLPDALEFIRLDRNQRERPDQKPRERLVSMSRLLGDAVQELVALARSKRVELKWSASEPDVVLTGDDWYLKRAVVFMLTRAIDSTPAGGSVRVTLATGGRRGQRCVRAVISPAIAASARTARATPKRRTTQPASAVDLPALMVQEIMRAHGGTLSVRRPVRGHPAWWLVFPPAGTQKPRPGPKRVREANGPESAASVNHTRKSRLPRILLVDDYADALEMWSFFLRSSGYDVFTATSGSEAMSQAERHQPDVILLDLQLPGMSGLEAARALRAGETTAAIPLLAVTGFSEPREHDEAFGAGLDDVVVKPCEPSVLLTHIERLLAKPRTTPEPAASHE